MKIKKFAYALIFNLTNEIIFADIYETEKEAKNKLFVIRNMKNWRISKIMIKEL
jgi:hypothetical protein